MPDKPEIAPIIIANSHLRVDREHRALECPWAGQGGRTMNLDASAGGESEVGSIRSAYDRWIVGVGTSA